ncbi:MAG: DNA internalization-related competence protein ComEC/Rec2, partial [Smithellaceae bacterium]|nr:DNA internalization-related competence protein ComEC/Rec2 [Smithellaceae bacterium]
VALISFFLIGSILKAFPPLLLHLNIFKVSALFSVFPVAIYALIAGGGISVLRAAIMALVFMIALFMGRRRDLYNTLIFAALVILVAAPYSLFDVSFQLSFAAVWALLFLSPRFLAYLPARSADETSTAFTRVIRYFTTFVLVSLAAILGVVPLVALYFNRLPLVALPANVVIVPLLGVLALSLSMALIATAPLSLTVSDYLLRLCSFLVDLSLRLVDFFAALPHSSLMVPTPTIVEIAFYYALMFFAGQLLRPSTSLESKGRTSSYGIALLAGLALLIPYETYLYLRTLPHNHLKLTVIDVGQGNAALLQLPDDTKILIDGGGFAGARFDVGASVLAPFLWNQRIMKIDYVILTHPHPDHMNGLVYILDRFHVRGVWTSDEVAGGEDYQRWRCALYRNKVKELKLHAGSSFYIGPVVFRVLNPPEMAAPGAPSGSDRVNNDSLVIRVTYGRRSFLFPGDISEDVERRLITARVALKSAFLLVPHHGGFRSSSTPFIGAVDPEIAVVSCGPDNVFHLPHPDVLRRYKLLKVTLLRTDVDGAISLESDGRILYGPSLLRP